MNHDTQTTIIRLLGLIAIVVAVELIPLLVFFPHIDTTIIIALINIPNAIAVGLVGYLTGKNANDTLTTNVPPVAPTPEQTVEEKEIVQEETEEISEIEKIKQEIEELEANETEIEEGA